MVMVTHKMKWMRAGKIWILAKRRHVNNIFFFTFFVVVVHSQPFNLTSIKPLTCNAIGKLFVTEPFSLHRKVAKKIIWEAHFVVLTCIQVNWFIDDGKRDREREREVNDKLLNTSLNQDVQQLFRFSLHFIEI